MFSNDFAIMKRIHPLKWHGGKYYLARWIVSQFPPHLHYVEPYFGGGAVLFARDPARDWLKGHPGGLTAGQRGCSEVVNDIYSDLTNFYTVVRDYFVDFLQLVELAPFCEHVWMWSQDMLADPNTLPIPRAVAFFIKMRMSRQGLGQDFATLSKRRTRGGINEQVNAYLNAVDGLADVCERLQTVAILNRSALDVIKSEDSEFSLFYLDPPYLHETRTATAAYAHEMDVNEHMELLKSLTTLEGKFLLSGYQTELYNDFAMRHKWRCMARTTPNHASSKSTKDVKQECLWSNY